MISLEEEKSKLLLDGFPYLRPLYIKGIISMYKILSISWKDSLIDLQNKYNNLKINDDNKNIINDIEIKEIKNKMFLIFSFMNHFYQMINKGKLKKYDGLDFIYSKLNNFLTFSRQIICYKILDINFEEFSQINAILKLLIHIKLFLIFCEYDTYQSPQGFINAILLVLSPAENSFKEINNINLNFTKDENKENKNNIDNNIINNNNIVQNEERKVIEELIKEIKKEKIDLDKLSLFVKIKYNSISEKYKQFIDEDKYTFFTILYETYFDLSRNNKENEKQKEINNKENAISSDEEEEESKKEEESKNCDSGKKKRKRKHKKKKNKNNENKEKNIISIYNNDNKAINKGNNTNELNNINIEEISNNKINKVNGESKVTIDNKNEINEITKENINKKITTIKTIQSIAKFVNKLIISNSSCQENKIDFDEIKRQFFEPLIPYIEQYKKIYGNKKMPILYLLQCAFITFEEKHRKEKEKLLKEIDNLKRSNVYSNTINGRWKRYI